MSIQTTHPEYDLFLPKILITKKAFDGDVKDFIPKLSGQTNQEYEAYRSRASFFNVTEKTVYALLGALLRKPYVLEGVAGDEPVCADNSTFIEFIQQCYLSILTTSKVGILVDYNEDYDSPYLVKYTGLDIINWSDNFVVLCEHVYAQDPKNPYKQIVTKQYRELFLDEEGFYTVRIWRKKTTPVRGTYTTQDVYQVVEVYQPTYRGKRLEFIPFTCVTPFDTSYNCYNPVLYNLATINIEHFKIAVDIAHVAHFLALPQPYLVGDLANEQQVIRVGTNEIIQLKPGSSLNYLEFSGNGVGFLMDLMNKKEDQMFNIGARFLQFKKGVESNDALNFRFGSESANLILLATSLESGLTEALETYNFWYGAAEDLDVKLSLNKDFTPATLSPQEIQTLIDAYVKNVISLDTLLTRLYEGEVVDNVETEKMNLLEKNSNT